MINEDMSIDMSVDEDIEVAYIHGLIAMFLREYFAGRKEEALDSLYSGVDSLCSYGEFATIDKLMLRVHEVFMNYVHCYEEHGYESSYKAFLDMGLGCLTLTLAVTPSEYTFKNRDKMSDMCMMLCRELGYSETVIKEIMAGL